MKKYSKTFDVNKIKGNFPYYVTDITEKLGVSKGTVYAWMKEGLEAVDDKSPYIFHGSTLRAFLKKRQDDRKWQCRVDEMPCFKCQQPRRPFKGKVLLQTSKGRKPNLVGRCTVCNSKMNKTINLKNLKEIEASFKLELACDSHLAESADTTTNHNNNIGD